MHTRSGFWPWLMLATLLLASTSLAQDSATDAQMQAERERQERFRAGFQDIVDDLNGESLERFTNAIDQKDMLDRIFGLRLIDQRIKRQFRESFDTNLEGIVKSVFSSSKDDIRATLLGFDSRGDVGRAVIRYDLADFQFGYHEYELKLDGKGGVIIVDWIDFLRGQKFSDGLGESLIMAAPGRPAVRKLLDFQNVREQQLFQMTELLKAARDYKVDRYFEILDGLDERLQGQRITVLTTVHLTQAVRNRRKLRTALIELAKHYPEEPLYSLMLLDYYFPSRRYEDALQALLSLEARLGVEDAAMQARLSAAKLVMGEADAAAVYADRAVELEPGLELGWWSALRARTAVSRFDDAVETLEVLEARFGYSLGRDAFEKDPTLVALLRSAEYEDWLASRE